MSDSMFGCFARLVWMVAGNVAVVLLALLIGQRPPWTFSAVDAAFWFVVLATVALRYVDVVHLEGQTTRGERATMQHFARHALVLLGVSGGLWTLAQSVQVFR